MKQIYALTWCYEGVDDNTPSAQTLAVSDSKEKLIEEMQTFINMDCEEIKREDFEDDEEYEEEIWNDDANYEVASESKTDVLLRHRMRTDLYTRYRIHSVKFI